VGVVVVVVVSSVVVGAVVVGAVVATGRVVVVTGAVVVEVGRLLLVVWPVVGVEVVATVRVEVVVAPGTVLEEPSAACAVVLDDVLLEDVVVLVGRSSCSPSTRTPARLGSAKGPISAVSAISRTAQVVTTHQNHRPSRTSPTSRRYRWGVRSSEAGEVTSRSKG